MLKNWTCVLIAVMAPLCVVAKDAPEPGAPAKSSEKVILENASSWRGRVVWETVETVLKSGEVGHYRLKFGSKAFSKTKKNILDEFKVENLKCLRLPRLTSPKWMKPDFDDSGWVRAHGPLFHKMGYSNDSSNWKLLLLRGRFEVADVAKVGDLTLSLVYKGGVVVYLNGEELTRSHMPGGKKGLYTAAEPYPLDASLPPDGKFNRKDSRFTRRYPERAKLRIRRMSGFRIPAAKLKKGANVLAIAISRAATRWEFYVSRGQSYRKPNHGWGKMGLHEVKLTARPDAAVTADVPTGGDTMAVWNSSALRRVYVFDHAVVSEPLRPVKIAGVRNGSFVGQVVVGHDKPIKGIKASAGELKGPGIAMPASVVQIGYPAPDGSPITRKGPPASFDTLESTPPPVVATSVDNRTKWHPTGGWWPVQTLGDSAVQPIWITVKVPADAKPGLYKGTITVTAENLQTVQVPLEVRVFDWALPDTKDFLTRMDFFQSPDSVAMEYKVPMWSPQHWKLLDKTFSLLGQLATKSIWITCVRRTHLGNEHAMVRWVRGEDGKLNPDFSIAEKYLDTAIKHLGKVPGVILYAWEPPSSEGHCSAGLWKRRTHDRDILISVVDPKTGKLKKDKGPTWGTPESREFWKKLVVGMKAILAKRGMSDSLMFGLLGDHRATKMAMDDMCGEDRQIKWAVHSHHYCDSWKGYEIGMCMAVWGVKVSIVDPEFGRGYGWKTPFWLGRNPRQRLRPGSPLVDYRAWTEVYLGAVPSSVKSWPKARGAKGLGRLGADFWNVLAGNRRENRAKWSYSIAGRYPETSWGQLSIGRGVHYLLGPGKTQPQATIRSEALRENLQEIEARIFIEKALLDKAKKAKLGAALAVRCREVLDDRIRMSNRIYTSGEGDTGPWLWFGSSGWEKRTEDLFRLAAEVAKKFDAK